jgi:hypothetical protein
MDFLDFIMGMVAFIFGICLFGLVYYFLIYKSIPISDKTSLDSSNMAYIYFKSWYAYTLWKFIAILILFAGAFFCVARGLFMMFMSLI